MPTADELLNAAAVIKLIECLRLAEPTRKWDNVRASTKNFDGLALGERSIVVRDALLKDLPAAYAATAKIVRKLLKNEAFISWMIWPVSEAAAAKAIASPKSGDFEDGLRLLAQLTVRFSSEFAIRSFLNADLQRTLDAAVIWTNDPEETVRRLASEGTRPRLPWAKQVPAFRAQPAAAIEILNRLYRDESEIVRRSVANHLNDISRADPSLAVRTAARWLKKPDVNTPRLVRHAMRTLIKQAHPGALSLMGFAAPETVAIGRPKVMAKVVPLGGELLFESVVVNQGSSEIRLVIDYVVHYQKANGTLAPKVFKLSTKTLAPGERLRINKRHSFKPISTRKHYAGRHTIELQVNGSRSQGTSFDVVT